MSRAGGRAGSGDGLCLDVYGLRISVQSDGPEILEAVEDFSRFHCEADGTA